MIAVVLLSVLALVFFHRVGCAVIFGILGYVFFGIYGFAAGVIFGLALEL